MTAQKEAVSDRELACMRGWRIAELLGCDYSGDADPILHGGYFYTARDWEAWGYAPVVELWGDPEDDDVLHVSTGTINKLEGDDLDSAFRCIGIEPNDPLRQDVRCQIEACHAYAGIEADDDVHVSYKLSNWKEFRIWRRVRLWIERLTA